MNLTTTIYIIQLIVVEYIKKGLEASKVLSTADKLKNSSLLFSILTNIFITPLRLYPIQIYVVTDFGLYCSGITSLMYNVKFTVELTVENLSIFKVIILSIALNLKFIGVL